LVEEGMAVGIIAAQSIGEAGNQLAMRTAHVDEKPFIPCDAYHATHFGMVELANIVVVTNDTGEDLALGRKGLVRICDLDGQLLESHPVPNGAKLLVKDGDQILPSQRLCE